jgi:hypothetical protein
MKDRSIGVEIDNSSGSKGKSDVRIPLPVACKPTRT